MTTSTAEEPVSVPDDVRELVKPVVTTLPEYPFVPCDGHAAPSIQGIFELTSPAWTSELYLCLNCARKRGFDVDNIKTWLHADTRTKGSAN